MEEKARVLEHTLSKILSIFRLPPKHHNTQFLEMIEGYWLSNTKHSQVQVIMKMKDKELKLEIKRLHSQCLERQER